jgi:hypothetical protein
MHVSIPCTRQFPVPETTQPRVRGCMVNLDLFTRLSASAIPCGRFVGCPTMNRQRLTGVCCEKHIAFCVVVKQTRRGSCDQRGELPGVKLSGMGCTRRPSQKRTPDERMIQGSIPLSNEIGVSRNPRRFMRLHVGTEVLSCGRRIPARLHCTVPGLRVNNAATRSRRGRGAWM